MPAVIFSRAAVRDIERVVSFLEEKNPNAAQDAKERITEAVKLLTDFPQAGRIIRDTPETREIIAGFGKSGYVLRYRIDPRNIVVIIRVWHGKENR